MGDFLRTPDGGGGISRLDFPAFVKAFAWVFYRAGERGGSSASRSGDSQGVGSGDSLSSGQEEERRGRATSGGEARKSRRRTHGSSDKEKAGTLGYGTRSGSKDRGGDPRGRRRGREVGIGIGEEAELRRWSKRLGEKQMRRLERVFDAWAEDIGGGSDGGGGVLEARDLAECFRELGRNVEPRELRAWCDGVDLAPGDALSLADFAYAFHAMFVDDAASGELRD